MRSIKRIWIWVCRRRRCGRRLIVRRKGIRYCPRIEVHSLPWGVETSNELCHIVAGSLRGKWCRMIIMIIHSHLVYPKRLRSPLLIFLIRLFPICLHCTFNEIGSLHILLCELHVFPLLIILVDRETLHDVGPVVGVRGVDLMRWLPSHSVCDCPQELFHEGLGPSVLFVRAVH